MAMSIEPPPQVPPARHGDVAIMEELEEARAKRAVEAYDLFIARHPAHPLASVAKRERKALLDAACK